MLRRNRSARTTRSRADGASNGSAASAAALSAAHPAAAAAAAHADEAPLERVDELMRDVLADPASFFSPNRSHAASCVSASQLLYGLSKSAAPAFLAVATSAPRLLTHSAGVGGKPVPFAPEQIYAQMAMHAKPLLQKMQTQIRVLEQHVAAQQEAQQQQEEEEEEQLEDMEEEEGEQLEDDEEQLEMGEDDEEDAELDDGDAEEALEDEEEEAEASDAEAAAESTDAGEYKGRGGVTEDAFFSLDDMEKFADMYEEDEDYGEIEGEDDEDEEGGEDDEEEEEEDEEMDLEALKRRAIRMEHDKKLRPLRKPGEEDEDDQALDLADDTAPVSLKSGERYTDFFDPPPAALLRAGKKAGGKSKSMEEHYAEEDAKEYSGDEDDMDEFGGTFRQLAASARKGELKGRSRAEGEAEEEDVDMQGEDQDGGSDQLLSSHEKSSRRMAEQISALEKAIVQPREWSQLGEVSGSARPADSLLTHDVEFELAGKQALPVTQEYTEELEALIRRRISKQQFDSVVRRRESDVLGAGGARKVRPNGLEELNSDKSAVGLAEVYEQEFMAQKAESEGRPSASEEATSKEHEEIGALVGALFHKLDALCNFHFTPRSIHADELSVSAKPMVAALAMEEVLPTLASDAVHVAPQELYDVSQQAMVGQTEATQEERKSKRRRIKAQRKKASGRADERERERMRAMGHRATEGNAAEGVLRTAISSAEMKAATSARNVIHAGGKLAPGLQASTRKGQMAAGGTKFSNSASFFGKMQQQESGGASKKQRTR